MKLIVDTYGHIILKDWIKKWVLTDDGFLKNLWDYALENYVSDSTEIEFDETAYFNLIDQIIELYGGKSFHYKEKDGAPGYCSVYIIYFAEDPEETITQINSFIIDQLES